MYSHNAEDPKGLKRPLGSRLPLVVIVGPTAAGKTDLAIELAERLGGEIVSADSRLFYRGMDIGTAKPTPAQRQRVPHHLIDVASPMESWSLAVFQQAAKAAIAEIHERGKLPFLVGGSGQYIHAVTHGWEPPKTAPDPKLRNALEQMAEANGKVWLYERLALLDPLAAAGIDPRNLRRTVRALEVLFSSGRRFSEQRGRGESPYQLLMIGLTSPRTELYVRIDARIEAMFAGGLLEEVQGLLEQGVSPDSPSMASIGYREAAAVLRGEMSVEEAKERMRHITRVFVRRQANWFKTNDPHIHWFQTGTDLQEMVELISSTFAGTA